MKHLEILVIEDNPGDFLLLNDILSDIKSFEKTTYQCEFLSAVHTYKDRQFDIILLDLSLPDCSGIETFEIIQAYYPNHPIVILSGNSDKETAYRAVEEGAQDFLVKGEVNAAMLEKSILYSLRRKKSEIDSLFQTTILKNVREGIIVTDLEGTITYSNEGTTENFGYAAQELLGMDLTKLYFDPIDKKYLKERLAGIAKGEDFFGEWQGKKKDGSPIWLEVKTRCMKNILGTPVGIIGVSRAIDERKKTEERILKSEANLKAIFNSTQQSLVLIDKKYKIISFNKVAFQFAKGLNRTMVEGMSMLEIITEYSTQIFLECFEKTLAGEFINTETKVKLPGDGIMWMETTYTPVIDESNHVIGVCLYTSNITQRKNDEFKIQEQNIALQRANAELDRFVYSASHDLKAPLSGIRGIINVAQMDEENSVKTIYLPMIEKNIDRLLKVIKNLTHFSRNARLEVIPEKIDFYALIEECISSLAFLKNSLYISFSHNVNKDLIFFSDKQRIEIILNNLISNAIAYHNIDQSNPYVNIDIAGNENYVNIKIKDNGQGIEKELQDKVFDMFYRASENSEGSGLGLYIVKNMVEKLQGEIELNSTIEKGAEFTIKLPRLELTSI